MVIDPFWFGSSFVFSSFSSFDPLARNGLGGCQTGGFDGPDFRFPLNHCGFVSGLFDRGFDWCHTDFNQKKKMGKRNSFWSFFGFGNPYRSLLGRKNLVFFLMKKKIKTESRGFTLIELLIVLTIIGLFILAALWTYQLQVFKGRDAKRKADLGKLQGVLEDYLKDHICYPETLECGLDFAPYLSQIPCDPVNYEGHIYYYSVSSA